MGRQADKKLHESTSQKNGHIYLYKAQNETKKIKPVSDMPITSDDLFVVQTAKLIRFILTVAKMSTMKFTICTMLFHIEEKMGFKVSNNFFATIQSF